MRLRELNAGSLRERLRKEGLALRTGPVTVRLRTRLEDVADALATLYADHELVAETGFCDFDARINAVAGLRRWIRPQAEFLLDGLSPFKPMPLQHASATLEWGLNWCVSTHCHRFIIIHAAAVERSGRVAVLPAPPGSGKSTLCAALVQRGWRLLSDELTLIDPASSTLVPLARPVSLKNQSIEIIQQFAPQAVFGPVTRDTVKGSVAHMRPPQDSVLASNRPARLGWVVFPRYQADRSLQAQPMPRGTAFMELIDNAFNYHLHGQAGFDCLAGMMEQASCLRLEYAHLDEAIAFFDQLATAPR